MNDQSFTTHIDMQGGVELKHMENQKKSISSRMELQMNSFVILWTCDPPGCEHLNLFFCLPVNLNLCFRHSFSVGVLYYGVVLMTTQVFQQIRPGESLCSAGTYLV